MQKHHLNEGYVHVITGDGPGKSTSAYGLAIRALGNGLKVCIIQFMKRNALQKGCGEIKFFKRQKNIIVRQFGTNTFLEKGKISDEDVNLAQKGMEYAKKQIMSSKFDLMILDEINVAMDFKLVRMEDIVTLIKSKPKNLELILTGRNAPKEIIELADYVVVINAIKHPFEKGVQARKGIEY
ncbi:MAG: cob(I)yrinic acid a,c-diamide adenosyltransferase [Nitrososphaeria archaeon]